MSRTAQSSGPYYGDGTGKGQGVSYTLYLSDRHHNWLVRHANSLGISRARVLKELMDKEMNAGE